MQRLRFINAVGAELLFDNFAPYVLWKVDGLGLPDITRIATQAAGQQGETLHAALLEPRILTLTAHVHGVGGLSQLYELRRQLNAVCNPLLGLGELVYENDYGKWRIRALVYSEDYAPRIRSIQTLTVKFRCPSPFWRKDEQDTVSMAYVDGGFRFPFQTPCSFGMLGYAAVVFIESDTDTPFHVWIDGGAVNPRLTLDNTGEYIEIQRFIPSNKRLYINTDTEFLEVSIVDAKGKKENAYGYLSPGSTLFKLKPGRNRFTFASEDENKRVKIRIGYEQIFVGV